MIYMISAVGTDMVKIGYTNNITARLIYLSTANFHELKVLRLIDAHPGVERWLHHHFAEHRVRSEWFHFVPEMLTIRPEDHADLFRLEREFWDAKDSMIEMLNGRRDLTYTQIADALNIPMTRFPGWVNVLANRGLIPHRKTRRALANAA